MNLQESLTSVPHGAIQTSRLAPIIDKVNNQKYIHAKKKHKSKDIIEKVKEKKKEKGFTVQPEINQWRFFM